MKQTVNRKTRLSACSQIPCLSSQCPCLERGLGAAVFSLLLDAALDAMLCRQKNKQKKKKTNKNE